MIQRVTPEMAEELTNISHAAKRHWDYPEAYIQLWKDDLTITADDIREKTVYGAWIDGKIGGFYVLGNEEKNWEIDHLWILPEHIGKGIGRKLFDHAINQLQQKGASECFILSDPYAEGFYQKMGAVRIEMKSSSIPGRQLPWMRMEW